MELTEIGQRAKEAASYLGHLGVRQKNKGLQEAARALTEGEQEILSANQEDVLRAKAAGMSRALVDRLKLTPERIRDMADGLQRWKIRWERSFL